MTYRIGNPAQRGGNYEYFISGSCQNYAQTIALTGLPEFVTHNEESQDFTIEYTEDVTLAGIYEVTISSIILIPDFPVQTTYTAVTHNYDFIIDVQDPCVLTFLDLVSVYPMHRFVGQAASVQTVGAVTDFVSENVGSFDGVSFCGERKYEMEPSLPFL